MRGGGAARCRASVGVRSRTAATSATGTRSKVSSTRPTTSSATSTSSSTTPASHRRTPIPRASREELWDKTLAVNLKGPFRLMALVGERMMAGDGGSIVNITSIGGVRPTHDILPYAAAKAGLNALTLGFADALGPKVRVNAVMPGPFLHRHLEALGPRGVRRAGEDVPAATSRRSRGGRRRRALLRERRVELHDRRGARGRRRCPVEPRGRRRPARLRQHLRRQRDWT